MIKSNLATRPFYNERAVHLAILLLALIVVLASVFNVTRVIQLSRSDTRLGTQAGTKAMIGLVQLGRVHGQAALQRGIEQALALGVHDGAAVKHLVETPQLERAQAAVLEIGALAAYERPQPLLTAYDALLGVAG